MLTGVRDTEQICYFCRNVHSSATASVIGKRSGTEEGADLRSEEYLHKRVVVYFMAGS